MEKMKVIRSVKANELGPDHALEPGLQAQLWEGPEYWVSQSRQNSIVLEGGGQKNQTLEEDRVSRVASKTSGLTDTQQWTLPSFL